MVFIRPQGHEGHHPYKQLLLSASYKGFVTKQSAQVSTALTATQHRAVSFLSSTISAGRAVWKHLYCFMCGTESVWPQEA